MSDLSKFADELEQLILTHATEAGIDIAEGLLDSIVKVVTNKIFSGRKEGQGNE